MRQIPLLAAAAFCALSANAFAAGEPAAIVEDVQSHSAGVAAMDYVSAGQRIRLGPDDRLVLGYLTSCMHEVITGGTVTIRATQSTVDGGKVTRTKTTCDGGQMAVSEVASKASTVMVFRAAPRPEHARDLPAPQLTLYGASPLIDVAGTGTLVIERLDVPGEHYDIRLAPKQLMRGAFFDFARADKALQPGGLYRAHLGDRQVVFAVDRFARPGRGPMVGRLLRFAAR